MPRPCRSTGPLTSVHPVPCPRAFQPKKQVEQSPPRDCPTPPCFFFATALLYCAKFVDPISLFVLVTVALFGGFLLLFNQLAPLLPRLPLRIINRILQFLAHRPNRCSSRSQFLTNLAPAFALLFLLLAQKFLLLILKILNDVFQLGDINALARLLGTRRPLRPLDFRRFRPGHLIGVLSSRA